MPGACPSRRMDRSVRVYELMLCAYPETFRIQFGREMQQVFRDSCRAAVMKKDLLRFFPRMLWDWPRTSLRERLATLGSPEIHLKGWWLLALCGALDAMYAAINLVMLELADELRLGDEPARARRGGLLRDHRGPVELR